MGKHSAPPRYNFLPHTRETLRGHYLPSLVIMGGSLLMAVVLNEAMHKPSAQSRAAVGDRFVKACGETLCKGATVFTPQRRVLCGSDLHSFAATSRQATPQGVNTIEIGNLISKRQKFEELISEKTWEQVDTVLDQARTNGQHVVLNLSDYVIRRSIQDKPASITEWENFLDFVKNRSVTDEAMMTYAQDPTIMTIKLTPSPECAQDSVPPNAPVGEEVIRRTQAAFSYHVVDPAPTYSIQD